MSNAYEQFFDELVDPIHLVSIFYISMYHAMLHPFLFQLRSKMLQTAGDSRREHLLAKLFRTNEAPVLVPAHERTKFSHWRMSSKAYFQTYSLLAQSSKSAYR